MARHGRTGRRSRHQRQCLNAPLLQVMVDTYANAYPKIAFGRPIAEMEPFAKPIEMEST
jgi:acetolactate synthase I/II/III large subunit